MSALAVTESITIDINRLLAALPLATYKSLAPRLEFVRLRLGDLLYEPGSVQRYAYFPTDSVVSLHYVMENGASAETAGVGNEGMVGVSLFTGAQTSPSSAIVRIAGGALRLESGELRAEFGRGGPLQRLLLLYMQSLIAQTAQTVICNRRHSVEQQLARWLLATLDRVPSGEVVVTQEMIAALLGVRRESVTEAAGSLQRAAMIRYRRGHIAVLSRTRLEEVACECYGVVAAETRRLFLPQAA